ncbi:hypothetical protein D3C85_1757180 [compost metagenome]
MRLAARQFPDDPRVHRSEEQFTLLRPRSSAIDVIEDPFDFSRRKIRINQQPRPLPKQVAKARSF